MKGGKMNMLMPTLIMAGVAIVLLTLAYRRGDGAHLQGFELGAKLLVQVLPLLFFAFLVAGLAQVLIPTQVISRWVGAESGFRGILIGCVAGGLTPGGPYTSFPIVAGLYQAGAGAGTIVGFITAWSLWAVTRLPLEIGFLGPKLTLIRIVSTLVFPPIAGLIANLFFPRGA